MVNRLIGFIVIVLLFLFSFVEVSSAACTGTVYCYIPGLDSSGTISCNVDSRDPDYNRGSVPCYSATNPSMCPIGAPCGNSMCSDSSGCSSCSCDWGSWSTCYVGGGGLCVKDRACNCSPSGCGSCIGDNWTTCTVTCDGNTSSNCPTQCDYPGGSLQGSRSGCGCATINCPATAACCSPTNPDAPSLSTPANGAVVASPVGLGWNAPSSWGNECSCTGTRNYRLCVSGTNSVDPCATGITATGLTGLSYSYSQSVSGVYYWTVRAVNKCGNVSANAPVRNFRINSPPTLNNSPPGTYLVLQNSVATVVPVDIGSSNHICQPIFTEMVVPQATRRQIRLVVTATDADGGSNISSVAVRLNAATTVTSAGVVTGDWALVSGVTNSVNGNNRTYTFHMSLGNSLDSNTLYNLEATATDAWGATTGWVDSGRDFKSWDCRVTVSGGVYDGSAAAVCTTTIGYTTYVGDSFNFRSLRFNKISDSSKVEMSVTRPATYNSGGNYLTWGNSYNNFDTDFNYVVGDGSIEGASRQVRISGGSVSGYICGPTLNLGSTSVVNPYSSVTSVLVDYSWVVNQEGWWQVEGGGIKMSNIVRNLIPVTCALSGSCRAAMSVSDTVLINSNGLVSGALIENNSGCGSSCRIGLPTNWYYTANLLNKTFSYEFLKQEYFVKYGEGVEVGNNWGDIKANTTDKVFFVNGNLTINDNLTLLANEFKMVIVSGNITIDPTVTRVDGIYLANTGFIISGANAAQLVIQGVLHTSGGNVSIDRSYVNKANNNTSPAVVIRYRPDIIFSMPANLTRALSGWKGGI